MVRNLMHTLRFESNKCLVHMALFILMLVPFPAHAEWREASSDHFVIYGNQSDAEIRTFADRLERYHAALRFVTTVKAEKPSPSNRLTVYVVSSDREVQELYGTQSSMLKGFYVPRAGGSIAIAANDENRKGFFDLSPSMFYLLHEYAHHYTLSTNAFPWPKWMSEGVAEFFAAAKFERDGTVSVGRPSQQRAAELAWAETVPIEEIFDAALYAKGAGAKKAYDEFYGRSWLLYHYLSFEPARKGQLETYQKSLARGRTSLESAKQAFGDLKVLDRELDSYRKRRKLSAFFLTPEKLTVSPITVRELGKGEAAAMPLQMRSRVGVDDERAEVLVAKARQLAKLYPDDPAVLSVLAEAEFDAGDDAAAIAAADRALAIDPARVNAYIQKGYALFRIAEDASDADSAAAYAQARRPFIALNRIENDHPLPLIYFYRSFVEQGLAPSDIAKQGLARAAQLAPFDIDLHMTLAMMYLRDEKLDFARSELRPVAYAPHGGGFATMAQTILAGIESGTIKGGPSFDPTSYMPHLEDAESETPDTLTAEG